MLQKLFCVTFALGIIFSLLLLVLLPAQVVGLGGQQSKREFVCFFLMFQVFAFLYLLYCPALFRYAYRAEVWKSGGLLRKISFLPNASQNEEKLQRFCESIQILACFVGIGFLISSFGLQWNVAANNGILPSVIPESALAGISIIFVVIPCIAFMVPLWNFLKP